MYNDSLLKKIGKAKKLAEQDAKNAFLNGGYENAAKEIQSLSDEIYQANRSGKSVNPDKIAELNNKLLRFNSFAATVGFDDKTRESLLGMGRSYVSLKDALKANNDTLTSRNTTYKQIDDIGKQQFKNIWFGMESNKEKDQAEAMRLREKKSKLKEKVAQYNRDIAPYLDVEATKKRLDNTSFFDFTAHDRAKTDYQNAREQKTGREAEEWLQDKKVKRYAKKAAEHSADTDEHNVQAGFMNLANTLGASGSGYNPEAMNAAQSDRERVKAANELKNYIQSKGYKESDEELDKLVTEIVRREKNAVTATRQDNINKQIQKFTAEHPVIGSAAAASLGTLAKLPGSAYAVGQAIKSVVEDDKVYNDANSAYFFGSNAYNQVTTTVKNEIVKQIEAKYDDPEVIKNKTKKAQMMYDGAMSGAENLIRTLTTAGLGEFFALAPMALAQLSDIALQKTIEGYNPAEAGYYAVIGAAAEYATEKMGLDALFGKVPGGRGMIVGYLTKLFKVGAAEGGEEIVSDVINDAADCLYELLSDKKSVREKEISHLMREGMSYKEAAEAYTHNKINEYIDDAVMGAAVGAVLGGGSTAVNISARTANIARNLSASKQQAQATNQQTINAIQAEFGGRLTAEAAADVAKERGQWIDGNAYYENLIEQAKNSYDPKVAQMGIDAEDDYRYRRQMKDGRVSIAKAGRLINHISAANIRATTGMATQMLESVGAKSGTVKAVVNAINGEDLSRKDIKNIKNSPDALSMLSQLYQENTGEAIFLSAESDNDTIREVAGAVQGATFNIDRNTDAGKMYSMAAGLRSENKLGFNGVQGFVNSYSPDLGLDDEGYSLMYQQAYSLAKSNEYSNMKPEEKSRAIADAMTEDFLEGIDNVQMYARVAAISSAVADAQNDVSLERKKSKETSEAEAEPDEDATQEEDTALEEDTSEADPVTKEAVESAKKLSRLSESEKAEKFKNGGAIVESKQKLTTQQSAIISFYDFRGKKHGITYRFVDVIESNAGARGEYNHQTEVITIRIGEVADMTATAGHELGHWLKAHYPEEYEQMQQYLKDTVFKTNYEAKVAAKIAAYKKADITIDEEAAFEELTNDCLFGVDMASSEYEEFVRANETLMQKAFRVIRELLEDLQHFMEDWRKQLPEMYKQVTEIKMVQELYDDVEFIEYTADWVDRILNRNANEVAENANEVAKNANEVAKNENTTAESGVINYSLGDKLSEEVNNYPYDMKTVIKDYLNAVDNNLVDFFEKAKTLSNSVKTYDLGRTTEQINREIREIFNFDTKGWNIKFEERIAHHIDIEHGENGKVDHSMANPEDLARMKYIIENHDYYGAPYKSHAYKEFVNGHNRSAPTITFAKKIDGTYYLVVAVPNTKTKTLWVNSTFINKKIEANQFRNASKEPLRHTSETAADLTSNNSISEVDEKSNSSFQVSDADYLEAARNGDEEKAAEYVEQAAKEWGAFSDGKPAPINLYHGTKSFGFTEFDLKKMDDKRSIFLTSDETTAQTYSGTLGIRKISEIRTNDFQKLSKKELTYYLEELRNILGLPYDSYEYWSKEDIDYFLSHKNEFAPEYEEEYHLFKTTSDDLHDGAIVKREGWEGKIIVSKDEACNILKNQSYSNRGNYSLYARFNNPLVIDCKGRNWNDIHYHPVEARYKVRQSNSGKYYIYDENTMYLTFIDGKAAFFDTKEQAQATIDEKLSESNSYKNIYRTLNRTREIAEHAQSMGYDGVIFKNICDDGGRGVEHSDVADYIAVAFDSAQVKSADPVTYDDNGEIIPLSERFSDDKDIRFQVADTVEETKDLVAVHNLSEEKLMKSLDLGGMPMPSIAVMKAQNNHHDFGDISLVFSKDTIDPKKGAKVWTGDAYTPTFPQVEYKLSDKATDIYMTALDLQRSGMVDNFRSIRFDPDNMFDRLNNLDFEDLIRKELQNDSTKMLYLYDTTGTVDAVELENIDKSNFEKWTRNLYESIIEKKGIKNNRDIYTSSGNRRSWEALHYEYNLENLVRAMKEKGTQGIGAFGSTIIGASKVEFNSVEDIKNNRDKLLDKTSPEIKKAYDETRKGITDRFYELSRSLPKYDDFTAIDAAAEMLTEAVLKFKTKTGMDNYIREQCEGWAHYSPSIVDDLLDIVNELRNLPAAYFEAKPQRGVSFNEVYTAVIPDNASAELKSALDKAGVKYQTYEAGNEEDRVRVINSLDEVKFQISDTTLTPEQQAAIERNATRREMAKLERENENLKAALDAALKQTKLSKDFRHDESKTAQIAKKLLRKFGVRDVEEGDYRFNRFVDTLNKFYDTIDDSKLEGTGGSDVTYMAALEAIESVRDSLEETDYTNADYLRDFLSDIGTPDSQGRIRYIYLNEDAARSVMENYGSFRNVISHTGNIHFKALQPGESHATLDEIWESEIADKWGDVVTGTSEMSTDGLINLTDSTMQAQVLINAIENARDVVQGRNTYNPLGDKTAFEAADEIIDGEATSDEAYIINEMIMDLYESYNDAEWQATFADKKANKERVKYLQYKSKLRQSMDRYRRQVNERNETYRQKIEKNYKERYQKAISRNDLRVQMEKERLAAYKEKVAENRKKATERKKQTEIKNKIRKMALELARLGGDPNKKKHLPNGLVKVTKEFLELIDTGDRNNGKLSQYVYNINTEFARIEGHPGYDALSDSYNNMIKGQIEEIAVEIGHKNLNELTSSELQKVWECAKTIKHSVVHMNRFFLAEKNATPEQYQQRLLQERKGKDSKKELVAAMGLKRFIDNDLKPYYFFNKLQSPTMNKLYDALRTGQDTWATDIQEGEDAIVAFKEKYNYNSWDQRKKYEFKLESGQTVSLNLQQIMSLRAYADREASYGHIYIGGIKLLSGTEATRHLKDKVTQRLDNTRYEISPADLEKITRTLSKEQTAYVIAMRNYLSSLGEKGNQVSRALFDLELFKEINYFPMRSSQEYTRQGEFKETGEKKLKNWGNAKPLVPGADNPLVIEEFNDVWARHVNEMALYHAFTLPLEDFQKVYGYYKVVKPAEEKELRKNFSDEKAFEEHMPTTASIRNLFSVSEQQYISQFLRNLNGGVKKADNTLSGRGIAKYKKMSTALNLRVAVQQPGAIARAFLYINPKYFAKTAGKGFTGFKSDSKTVQEMEKYSGAAFIKSMGYFDVDTGKTAEEFLLESGDNYKGAQKVKGFFFDGKYRDSLLLMGPEVMDRITWVQIWAATKAKVAAEEGLTGKALLKRTGKVFSDVVDKTQVYDSVFTRSGHMRSTDALAKMATSFMAEPTTTINMIYDAVTQCRAGKVNKKFVAGAFASCFTATLFTNLLASVVSAFRHGKKDDNWWELWTGEFTADALNDIILLNSLPIVRDIYNLAKGFDIERADMTLISDWVSSVQKLNEASQKGKLTYKEWINFLSSSAVMLGLPLKSLYKDINGIFTAYQIVTNGTSPTREGIRKAIKKGTLDTLVADDFLPIAQPSTNKYDTIYLLYAGGNKKEAEKRKKILFKYDEKATQDKLDAYIKGQLKENKDVIRAADALKSGDLSKTKSELSKIKNFDKEIVLKAMVQIVNDQVNDEEEKVGTDTLVKVSSQKTLEQNVLLNNKLVRQAAIALNKNDDEARYNAQRQLVNQGFKIDDVVKVTRTIKNKMFPGEKKENTSSKNGMKYFQYTDVADALKANKAKFARDVVKKLESDYAKDGKSAADVHKQVRSKITSTFKEEYYMANESRRAEIRKLMWASGAYDSVDDVTKACKKWVKDIAKKKYSN